MVGKRASSSSSSSSSASSGAKPPAKAKAKAKGKAKSKPSKDSSSSSSSSSSEDSPPAKKGVSAKSSVSTTKDSSSEDERGAPAIDVKSESEASTPKGSEGNSVTKPAISPTPTSPKTPKGDGKVFIRLFEEAEHRKEAKVKEAEDRKAKEEKLRVQNLKEAPQEEVEGICQRLYEKDMNRRKQQLAKFLEEKDKELERTCTFSPSRRKGNKETDTVEEADPERWATHHNAYAERIKARQKERQAREDQERLYLEQHSVHRNIDPADVEVDVVVERLYKTHGTTLAKREQERKKIEEDLLNNLNAHSVHRKAREGEADSKEACQRLYKLHLAQKDRKEKLKEELDSKAKRLNVFQALKAKGAIEKHNLYEDALRRAEHHKKIIKDCEDQEKKELLQMSVHAYAKKVKTWTSEEIRQLGERMYHGRGRNRFMSKAQAQVHPATGHPKKWRCHHAWLMKKRGKDRSRSRGSGTASGADSDPGPFAKARAARAARRANSRRSHSQPVKDTKTNAGGTTNLENQASEKMKALSRPGAFTPVDRTQELSEPCDRTRIRSPIFFGAPASPRHFNNANTKHIDGASAGAQAFPPAAFTAEAIDARLQAAVTSNAASSASSEQMVAVLDFDPSTLEWPFEHPPPLRFAAGDIINIINDEHILVEDETSEWIYGATATNPDVKGLFPKRYVAPMAFMKRQPVLEESGDSDVEQGAYALKEIYNKSAAGAFKNQEPIPGKEVAALAAKGSPVIILSSPDVKFFMKAADVSVPISGKNGRRTASPAGSSCSEAEKEKEDEVDTDASSNEPPTPGKHITLPVVQDAAELEVKPARAKPKFVKSGSAVFGRQKPDAKAAVGASFVRKERKLHTDPSVVSVAASASSAISGGKQPRDHGFQAAAQSGVSVSETSRPAAPVPVSCSPRLSDISPWFVDSDSQETPLASSSNLVPAERRASQNSNKQAVSPKTKKGKSTKASPPSNKPATPRKAAATPPPKGRQPDKAKARRGDPSNSPRQPSKSPAPSERGNPTKTKAPTTPRGAPSARAGTPPRGAPSARAGTPPRGAPSALAGTPPRGAPSARTGTPPRGKGKPKGKEAPKELDISASPVVLELKGAASKLAQELEASKAQHHTKSIHLRSATEDAERAKEELKRKEEQICLMKELEEERARRQEAEAENVRMHLEEHAEALKRKSVDYKMMRKDDADRLQFLKTQLRNLQDSYLPPEEEVKPQSRSKSPVLSKRAVGSSRLEPKVCGNATRRAVTATAPISNKPKLILGQEVLSDWHVVPSSWKPADMYNFKDIIRPHRHRVA